MTTAQVGDRCCADPEVEGEMMYGIIVDIKDYLAYSNLTVGFCGDVPTRKLDGVWVFDSF